MCDDLELQLVLQHAATAVDQVRKAASRAVAADGDGTLKRTKYLWLKIAYPDRLRLSLEAFEYKARREDVVPKRLDGDLSVEAPVPCDVNRTESTTSDQAAETVPVAQRTLEPISIVGFILIRRELARGGVRKRYPGRRGPRRSREQREQRERG